MGTWGTGPFENDAALDWAADLVEQDDWTPIADVLKELLECEPDDRDADLCSAAMAAAATVSIQYCEHIKKLSTFTSYDENVNEIQDDSDSGDSSLYSLPDEVSAYLDRIPDFPANLKAAATHSIKLTLEKSELRELWMESEEGSQQWVASLREMLTWLPSVPDYKVSEAKQWVTPKVTLATGFQPKFKNLEKDVERFSNKHEPISRNEYQAYGMKAYEDAQNMPFFVYWTNKVWEPLVKFVKNSFDYRFGPNRYLDELSLRLLEDRQFDYLFEIWDKVKKQQSANYRQLRRDQKKWPDTVHDDQIIASRGRLILTLAESMRISRLAGNQQRLDELRETYDRVLAGKNP